MRSVLLTIIFTPLGDTRQSIGLYGVLIMILRLIVKLTCEFDNKARAQRVYPFFCGDMALEIRKIQGKSILSLVPACGR